MLVLKMMSSQELPDDDPTKDHEIIQIATNERLKFFSTGGSYSAYTAKVVALVRKPDGSEDVYPLEGNAYVMNESGKTISSRSPHANLAIPNG